MAARRNYKITDSILYKIHRLSRSLLKAAMKSADAHFDLTVPEIRVLSVISSDAPLASTAVVDIAAMDKALVSRALDKLLKRKLVRVTGDPRDQRRYQWSLTASGQALADRVDALRQVRQGRFLADISQEERQALAGLLDRLYAASEAASAIEAVEIATMQRTRPAKKSARQSPSSRPPGQGRRKVSPP